MAASNKTGADRTASAVEGEVSSELVAACQRGDRDAQQRLYMAVNGRVFGLMVRMVGRQDAPDLTQQVFLQVYRSIANFKGHSSFATWLWRVAANEARQHLRRRKARPSVDVLQEPESPHRRHTEIVEMRELLEQALQRIEPELRLLFLLRQKEELSYGELSTALELPEGTIASRLNRARHELRQHLLDLGWEP